MASDRSLITDAKNTWCPGCGNFAIQHAFVSVVSELGKEGIPREKMVVVSGIGCHAKIADYLQMNSFYSLHGRTIPVATGIKMANPDMSVICFAGDGDLYAEGIGHLVHAAKRNIDVTVICHNNRVYGLTTGQYTPTSPYGFRGRSTPRGIHEYPLNVLDILLSCGATFIARGYSRRMPLLKRIIREAILHHGFAHVDILQICASFFNLTRYYDELVYEIPEENTTRYDTARELTEQWNYNDTGRIPLGILYKAEKPSIPETGELKEYDRMAFIRSLLDQE
ncbi:MAG: 2-oxoacid:ferredoxin oxidoreductase subunit beta [Methanospirillaceae archaeon]|nr:2-oxoacid:ferredoxin oxidoreductase subunit beta [Methanospirillaceae archaeon]